MFFYTICLFFFLILFFKFIYFIYFWLCWVFIAVCGLSLVGASGGYSPLRCMGFSLQWLLLLRSTGSRCAGFSSCSTRASVVVAQGLIAPRHVGSSRTRAGTCVPCIGRQILNHCATRAAPFAYYLNSKHRISVTFSLPSLT